MAEENKQVKEINVNIKKEAIELVNSEWRTYENAVVFVTEKVAFNLRNLIKTLRKNYWGIFDTDTDPVTGKKMTWIGITEWICDTWVKNSDRDSGDIRVKAKNGLARGLTTIVRYIVTNWMDKEIFGETIDETERQMAIDGSHIWKTYKGYDENGKVCLERCDVDLLNAYFDPTAKSIQKAYRFTERSLQTPEDIAGMDGWMDTDNLKGSSGLHPTDTNLRSTNPSDTTKYVDVWETWGWIPKRLITGEDKDKGSVQGHIVVSNLQGGVENARVHLIETNPSGLKPYEEGHTKKILGRWLARGPAESVMMLQSWINMIVNIRKVKHQVSQLGIYKLKKGSGVSPQNVSKMVANGVITVNSMDDVEQFVMNEASQSSYKDEDTAVNWAQRVTSSYDAVTGETMPVGTTATNGIIQQKAAGSSFIMFKKQIGFFLERWLKRHAIPILTQMLTVGDIIRMTADPSELEQFDDLFVNYLTAKKIDEDAKKGITYQPEEVLLEMQRAKTKLRKMGIDRYIELVKEINLTDYDVLVYTDDEKFNPSVQVEQLMNMLKVVPQYQNGIAKSIFDIMGIDSRQLEDRQSLPNMAMNMMNDQVLNPQSQPINIKNEQQQVTQATV
jgi:hypothetical protein